MIIRRKTESYMKFGLNLFWNSVMPVTRAECFLFQDFIYCSFRDDSLFHSG